MHADSATDYRLALARGFLAEAEQDRGLARWRSCVDNSQLAVENSGKAVVSLSGTLTIEYPELLPYQLRQSREEFEREARLALAVKLFEMKRVSSGIAASIAGVERVELLLELHIPRHSTQVELDGDLRFAFSRQQAIEQGEVVMPGTGVE